MFLYSFQIKDPGSMIVWILFLYPFFRLFLYCSNRLINFFKFKFYWQRKQFLSDHRWKFISVLLLAIFFGSLSIDDPNSNLNYVYEYFFNEIYIYTFGQQFVKLDSQIETFLYGFIVLLVVIYLHLYVINFMTTHHTFGFILFIISVGLYFTTVPIDESIQNSAFFIVDYKNNFAYFSKGFIFKLILLLTVCFNIVIVLFKSLLSLITLMIQLLLITSFLLFIFNILHHSSSNTVKNPF